MTDSRVVRLRDQGGNLALTIPRALARELRLARRDYVRIFRSGPFTLTIVLAEVHPRDAAHVPESPA
jgi:antitoxin component of MazEF toxin-antitoxin module